MPTSDRILKLFIDPRGNGFPVLIALIGLFSIFCGYDLFRQNILEGGAALTLSWDGKEIFSMGKGGPGLIFLALGVGLLLFAIKRYSKLRVGPPPE